MILIKMWLLLYNTESIEVSTLISFFTDNKYNNKYLKDSWIKKVDKNDHCIIQLTTDDEINNVVKNSKNIRIREFPVVLNVDDNNKVKEIYYITDIFDPDEFDLAITIDSRNKPF